MNIRKITVLFCVFALIFIYCFGFNSYAAGELAWFCIRSRNQQPPITEEERLLNKYGGISIDRSVNDESDKKVIYLTFDVGYENGNVARILDAMCEESVTGAFFLLDNIILKNPELVTRMKNEGHLICNHTRNHKNLTRCSKEEIYESISSLEKILNDELNITMEKIFRFPEGKYSEYALSVINDMGYRTVFWSFAYDDWDNGRQPNNSAAIRKILNNTHNGAIFLFHPTSATNADIFPTLLKEWKTMGYEFGSLNDIEVPTL